MSTELNVEREAAALMQMTVKELRGRYLEVFGEATRSGNKDFLWKRIAWRMQANAAGDLTERARRRAEELANDADMRIRRPPEAPAPPTAGLTRASTVTFGDRADLPVGMILTRQYKGQVIQVTVVDNGFRYLATTYRSLSAVAKAVTGSHWNGKYFFNVYPRKKEG